MNDLMYLAADTVGFSLSKRGKAVRGSKDTNLSLAGLPVTTLLQVHGANVEEDEVAVFFKVSRVLWFFIVVRDDTVHLFPFHAGQAGIDDKSAETFAGATAKDTLLKLKPYVTAMFVYFSGDWTLASATDLEQQFTARDPF